VKVATDAPALFVLEPHELASRAAQFLHCLAALGVEIGLRDLVSDTARESAFVAVPEARRAGLTIRTFTRPAPQRTIDADISPPLSDCHAAGYSPARCSTSALTFFCRHCGRGATSQ